MNITVVVATCNRAAMLERMLQALARQTMPASGFAVVVALDGVTDDSRAVCERMTSILPNLTILTLEQQQGQTRALIRGLAAARTEKLAFTDDDCVPEPGWLERMDRELDSHELVAGGMRSSPRPFFRLCHNIAQFHPFLTGRRGEATMFLAGANFGCRRSLLDRLGGLDTGENMVLSHDMVLALKARAAGVRVRFARDAVVWHEPDREDLSSVLRYAAQHARWTILLRRRFAAHLPYPLAFRSPVLLALASPLIALQVTGSIYLRNPDLWRQLHTAPVVCMAKFAWCMGAVAGLLGERRT